mmetsp:Transcript_6592/g.13348  ORF Transcript_6592/g.13348 Transcript_6592/m.13348 type:complete len:763 (+) Transcript_6592:854-3142(+)
MSSPTGPSGRQGSQDRSSLDSVRSVDSGSSSSAALRPSSNLQGNNDSFRSNSAVNSRSSITGSNSLASRSPGAIDTRGSSIGVSSRNLLSPGIRNELQDDNSKSSTSRLTPPKHPGQSSLQYRLQNPQNQQVQHQYQNNFLQQSQVSRMDTLQGDPQVQDQQIPQITTQRRLGTPTSLRRKHTVSDPEPPHGRASRHDFGSGGDNDDEDDDDDENEDDSDTVKIIHTKSDVSNLKSPELASHETEQERAHRLKKERKREKKEKKELKRQRKKERKKARDAESRASSTSAYTDRNSVSPRSLATFTAATANGTPSSGFHSREGSGLVAVPPLAGYSPLQTPGRLSSVGVGLINPPSGVGVSGSAGAAQSSTIASETPIRLSQSQSTPVPTFSDGRAAVRQGSSISMASLGSTFPETESLNRQQLFALLQEQQILRIDERNFFEDQMDSVLSEFERIAVENARLQEALAQAQNKNPSNDVRNQPRPSLSMKNRTSLPLSRSLEIPDTAFRGWFELSILPIHSTASSSSSSSSNSPSNARESTTVPSPTADSSSSASGVEPVWLVCVGHSLLAFESDMEQSMAHCTILEEPMKIKLESIPSMSHDGTHVYSQRHELMIDTGSGSTRWVVGSMEREPLETLVSHIRREAIHLQEIPTVDLLAATRRALLRRSETIRKQTNFRRALQHSADELRAQLLDPQTVENSANYLYLLNEHCMRVDQLQRAFAELNSLENSSSDGTIFDLARAAALQSALISAMNGTIEYDN